MPKEKEARGLHTGRLSQNPIERALSDGWAEEVVSVSPINKNTLLDGLLELQGRENNRPLGYATERDHVIAATVVQWLGSPVGFYFLQRALEGAGYEVKKINQSEKNLWVVFKSILALKNASSNSQKRSARNVRKHR